MTLSIQDVIEAVANAVESALGASLLDILIQVLATLLLVIIVKIFFWDRILEFLEKRRSIMEEELVSAKKANEEAKKLEETKNKEYQELKDQAKDIVVKAKAKGNEERDIIIDKARLEAKNILDQAQSEIVLEKQKAKSEIRKEAVDLAALMASKIIEKEIDEKDYQDLSVEKIEGSEKI